MKNTSHTTGPWKSISEIPEGFSIQSDGKIIAMIPLDCEEAEANARLIAAAPNLLNACITALEEGDELLAIQTLKAAIAKAQG